MTPGIGRKEGSLLLEEQHCSWIFSVIFFSACENSLGYLFMKLCLDVVFFLKYPLVYTQNNSGTCCVY